MANTMVAGESGQSAGTRRIGTLVFLAALAAGAIYVAVSLVSALTSVSSSSSLAYILLGIALLIALGFEFVNGFHDTANAVATVIYTHSLQPNIAVVWSGVWNFLGVLTSSGAVAFGIVSLLPVELILQVGSGAGFAMVFSLLIAAIIWNLGTWWLGIPNSSSHTLIGSIIGVGLMNQLLSTHSGTSGVDWGQATNILKSLLFSPLVGFVLSGALLLLCKLLIKAPALYEAPKSSEPPPFWIRGLLILTCTGVSFAHGSNDGQKGMGLIMLILIGTVPTAFALNRAVSADQTQVFGAVAQQTSGVLHDVSPNAPAAPDNYRGAITHYIQTKTLEPTTVPALAALTDAISKEVTQYGALSSVPQDQINNVRNDMYLSDEAFRLIDKSKNPAFNADQTDKIKAYRKQLGNATKYIPDWVKVAVALALGLGTMVGWKRIVVTVGEKIGKEHLTYAQGASAELVAMTTIGMADMWGLPVSTTHVLSSGVAGTMAANGSGLQWPTIRSLIMAWVLTLPASIVLAGGLFFVFKNLF